MVARHVWFPPGPGSAFLGSWPGYLQSPMRILGTMREATRRAPELIGSPLLFVGACLTTLVWLGVGPAIGYSDAWLVLPATATSIGAFLLVLVPRYSQNRDTRALQLKLDELIRSLHDARTHLVGLQDLTDEELDVLETEFSRLRESASQQQSSGEAQLDERRG